jgi:uncharacterized protein
MPEYLAPGVYIEEVSYRAKSIEGVSTSVAGFVGPTRYGPVGGEPELLTSFADFNRIYGGLEDLNLGGVERINFMAHAVRAFFDNGGTKLYVTRIYEGDEAAGRARLPLGGSPAPVTLEARFPGRAGALTAIIAVKAGANVLVGTAGAAQLRGLREHDTVFLTGPSISSPNLEGFFDVTRTANELVLNQSGTELRAGDLTPGTHRVHAITLAVSAQGPGRFDVEQLLGEFSPHPQSRNALTAYFTHRPASRGWFLSVPFAMVTSFTSGAAIVEALLGTTVRDALTRSLATDAELTGASPDLERPRPQELHQVYLLQGGSDGGIPTANTYRGSDTGMVKTGLATFEDVDEISIVATPGATFDYVGNEGRINQTVQNLLTHVERMRYRVAVLDSPGLPLPQILLPSEVRNFRGQFDSTHAALYYPWIRILDPLDPDGRREITLPPSGYVAGIYARNDVEKGVHKAPANEVVRGAIGFELLLNKAQQDVLNPEGVNCFRFFEGRGFRLWGARTISSDPEWKYISNRRYFAYLEHSLDKGTQWAVFENNNEPLWANVRRTIEDFLFNEWRNGALMGTKPEEAFFVRCDRSTMTQNDLDNGRLICLIGVAVVKPAEYVIFRIGQWTADRKV